LKAEGFDVLTQIDVKKTLHEKIGVEFRNYRILGACNPQLAHEALKLEDKIGTMLPCNIVVQQLDGGQVEVAAIDPVARCKRSIHSLRRPLLASVRSLCVSLQDSEDGPEASHHKSNPG
jgi:uncharacterized protein (DUF302 family)